MNELPKLPLFPAMPNMAEVNAAAHAMKIAAEKWGHVADLVTSWHTLAACVLGGLIVWCLFKRG